MQGFLNKWVKARSQGVRRGHEARGVHNIEEEYAEANKKELNVGWSLLLAVRDLDRFAVSYGIASLMGRSLKVVNRASAREFVCVTEEAKR